MGQLEPLLSVEITLSGLITTFFSVYIPEDWEGVDIEKACIYSGE
jgi:hypothetical protein